MPLVWCDAVSDPGRWGRWHDKVCMDVDYLRTKVEEVMSVRV